MICVIIVVAIYRSNNKMGLDSLNCAVTFVESGCGCWLPIFRAKNQTGPDPQTLLQSNNWLEETDLNIHDDNSRSQFFFIIPDTGGHIWRAARFVSSFFFVTEVQLGRMVVVLRQVERILVEFENYRILWLALSGQKWITISGRRQLPQFPFPLVLNHHHLRHHGISLHYFFFVFIVS